MEKRAFRLNGNAENTKVGALHIDLLVHAEVEPAIYANIVLEDEAEHQPLGGGKWMIYIYIFVFSLSSI